MPKPGPKLASLIDAVIKLELAIEGQSRGGDAGVEKILEDFIKKLDGPQLDPDSVKFIMDRLSGAADAQQISSDQKAYQAQMLLDCASAVGKKLIDKCNVLGSSEISGPSWKAKIVEDAPFVQVDWKAVRDKSPDFMRTIQIPDEIKIQEAYKNKTPVAGVVFHPQHHIEFEVIKAAQ